MHFYNFCCSTKLIQKIVEIPYLYHWGRGFTNSRITRVHNLLLCEDLYWGLEELGF